MLAEPRRREVPGPGAGVGVVVEAQRRAGQVHGAERWVVDLDAAGPARGSGPRRRRRRSCAPCPPGRRRRRAGPASARRRSAAKAPPARRSARRGGRPARALVAKPVVGGSEPGRAQRRHSPSRAAGDLDRRVGGVRTCRTARSTGWWSPDAPRHLAGHRPPGALEGVHADDRGQQRGADHAAAAGAGRARAARRPRRRRRSSRRAGPRSARRPWSARLGAGDRHQPALALRDLVVAGPAALGTVVAEAGDRQHDQAAGSARAAARPGSPSRSSTPTRKFSISTSARRTSRASTSRVLGDLRSRMSDSLLRLAERKYVDSRRVRRADERRPPAAGVVAGPGPRP